MIGIVLAISALLSILMTVFLYPALHKTLSQTTYLRLCGTIYLN